MTRIKLYVLMADHDTTEGRGPMYELGYFRTYEDALKVRNDPRYARWCVMGVHRPVKEGTYEIREKVYLINESADEFWGNDEASRREKALAKLTVEERKLLGLKDEWI